MRYPDRSLIDKYQTPNPQNDDFRWGFDIKGNNIILLIFIKNTDYISAALPTGYYNLPSLRNTMLDAIAQSKSEKVKAAASILNKLIKKAHEVIERPEEGYLIPFINVECAHSALRSRLLSLPHLEALHKRYGGDEWIAAVSLYKEQDRLRTQAVNSDVTPQEANLMQNISRTGLRNASTAMMLSPRYNSEAYHQAGKLLDEAMEGIAGDDNQLTEKFLGLANSLKNRELFFPPGS